MVIGRYLQWVETAPLAARIEAARTLVAIYTAPETDPSGQADVELALFALLDDPASAVRRALAEAIAHEVAVPRHLVAALAQDQSSVAVPVLRFSPLLDDADLVDAVAIGDAAAQRAVALRALIRASVAAALVEVGDAPAVVALCCNENADIPPAVMRRMLDRFRDEADVREAMLARGDLDPGMRHDLVAAITEALTRFALECAWMSPERADRITRETRDKAAVTIAAHAVRHEGAGGPRRLVSHLRACGHLTPALILRALLSGNLALFEAALAELSGASPIRVAGHVRDAGGLGFASLYAKSGLPPALLPAFRTALASLREGRLDLNGASGTLQRPAVIRVLEACLATRDPDLGKVAALLRRFEAEAVRDEARAVSMNAWAEDSAEAFPDLLPWIVGSPQTTPQLTFQSAA